MSEEEEKPVIEVTEENWEEDTAEVDVSHLHESIDRLDAPQGGDDEAPAPPGSSITGEEETPPAGRVGGSDDPPIDEELSDSLRPVPPPVPSIRPSERPDLPAEPPEFQSGSSSLRPRPTGFSHPAVAVPSSPLGQQLQKARRTGTGIWYAGVFLWAYIVVGEYVIGPGLPEFFGWSAFAGIVVGTFLHGANRIGTSTMRRVAAISVASVIGATFFLGSIVGSSRRSEYQTVSLLLLIVSVALVLWGIRFSRGGIPNAVLPKGNKWTRLATWILFIGNTGLIAIAFLAQM